MQRKLVDIACSISKFKKNTASVLREARGRPLVVLNNYDKPVFYVVEPQLFEAMVEELGNNDMYKTLLGRISEKAQAVEIDIDVV